MQEFYSHGKLLLTGEYYVLDGATALAIPVTRGQSLRISKKVDQKQLQWYSLDDQANCWLQMSLALPDCLASNSFGPTDKLITILRSALELNPKLLQILEGAEITTFMSFPRNWGLGSSSTLINNIAQLAKVNPYKLLEASFGGSGYDIACASANGPILYQRQQDQPQVKEVNFEPTFANSLYFVHLGRKQSSVDAIRHYLKNRKQNDDVIERLNGITRNVLLAKDLSHFENLMEEHESIIAENLQLERVKDRFFSDYWGSLKSLGAWGGDFALASSHLDQQTTKNYFYEKGFHTFLPWNQMLPSLKTSS